MDEDEEDDDDDPKSTSCLCSISYDVDSLIQSVTFSQQGGVEPGFTRFPAGSDVPQGFWLLNPISQGWTSLDDRVI